MKDEGIDSKINAAIARFVSSYQLADETRRRQSSSCKPAAAALTLSTSARVFNASTRRHPTSPPARYRHFGGLVEDLAPPARASKLCCHRRRARASRATPGGMAPLSGPASRDSHPSRRTVRATSGTCDSGRWARRTGGGGAGRLRRAGRDEQCGLRGGRYLISRPGVDGNPLGSSGRWIRLLWRRSTC